MNETQRRIKAYRDALPGLRERIAAVALLLVMSITMMTSATFAWLTISRAPEVSGVNTTVAANGNLEIALANSNDTAPGVSKVGDSSATKGQAVTTANLTWGNLVNLSDPSYGLENLTLRPAQLNESALLTSPLYGAVYSADGRVQKLTSNFAYTSWVPASGNIPGYFGLSNNLGVRAISSTKIEAVGFYSDYLALKEAADITNVQAGNAFTTITKNSEWMASLATMMGVHMTASLNYEDEYINKEVSPEDLNNLIDMYDAFIEAFGLEAQALANSLNFQLFLAYGGDTNQYTAYTASTLLTATPNSGKDFVIEVADGTTSTKTVKITNLKTFIADYEMLVADVETLRSIAAGGDRRWTASGLKKVVNRLVNVNECLVDGKTVSALLDEFSDSITSALGYMGKEVSCVITNGVLYNFEQRTGTNIQVTKTNSNGKTGLPVTATMYVSTMNLGEQSATIYATITTAATKPSEFTQDLTHAESLNTGAGSNTGVVTAQDTYGLAIDLWVRTNASTSYLTLEGNILTVSEEVVATGKDANGNSVDLYTLSRTETETSTDEDGEETTESVTLTYTLYKVETTEEDDTVTTTWYNADTYNVFTLNEGEAPTVKMETLVTVTGYQGENRVWNGDNKSYISTDSTTQGSGSCYVYYADTPEDQARSLQLLEAFNVAFVDADGELLATAKMDTAHYYADSGRVIVPLVLDISSIDLGEDAEGNHIYAITALEKNVPTRITAIVYLDGTQLSNQEVLAAADIQGQLNIQFGSNQDLHPLDNESLEGAERRVSASVSNASFDYDTATGPMTTTVTIHVDGDAPSTVTAFFMRQINSTQGSREEKMTFTQNDNGEWVTNYTFTAPGNYVLRTVQLDGQDYVLSTTPTVTVTGFAVQYLNCQEATSNKVNIMTAANSGTVHLNLKFVTSDPAKMPGTVQGRFLRADGTAVNINFAYNPTTQVWSGSATFLSSGDYTLQYLVLDGEYMELDSGMHQTATVYLGMKVAVYTTSPTSFKFLPSEMTDDQKNLGMQVKIMDNTGAEMQGLSGAKLIYGMQGSAIKNMNTDLTWNAAVGYYVGELHPDAAGIFKFSAVTVGDNTVTNATTSPTFTIISPEPPSYDSFQPQEYQFAPNAGDGKMNAKLKYSSTATVMAIIADAAGNTYEVQGTPNSTDTDTNITEWFFTVPTVNSTQDGYWTMQEIRVWNYYDADGNYISAEVDEEGNLIANGERDEPLVFDMLGENYTTKVVQTVNVSFPEGQSKDFSGQFLDTHTISGINVNLYDFENQAIKNVTGMKLVYDYDGNTKDYGGYTSDSVSATSGIFTIELSGTSINFVQTDAQTVQYAGTYTPASFSFTVNGQKNYTFSDNKMPANVPSFTVSSVAPTVTITGVSTNASTDRYYLSSTPSSLNVITGSYNWKSDDGFSAAVYMYVSAKSGSLDQEQVAIKYPSVTLSLAGVPAAHTGVTMVVPNGSNSTYSNTIQFASGKTTATGTIGAGTDGVFDEGLLGLGSRVSSWPVFYPVGKQTVDEITVKYDEMTFTVDLSHAVTINQPQYPPYVDFKDISSIDSTYTGTTPSRVYSEDGETVTLTLPTIAPWTTNESSTVDGTYTAVGTPTTRTVYTEVYNTWEWFKTYYDYTKYTETKTTYQATSTKTTWVNTHTITGWNINGKVYKPGDTVSITETATITAIVTVTEGTKTTATTTGTYYAYTYTQTAKTTKVTSVPSGYGTKVDSASDYTTDPTYS